MTCRLDTLPSVVRIPRKRKLGWCKPPCHDGRQPENKKDGGQQLKKNTPNAGRHQHTHSHRERLAHVAHPLRLPWRRHLTRSSNLLNRAWPRSNYYYCVRRYVCRYVCTQLQLSSPQRYRVGFSADIDMRDVQSVGIVVLPNGPLPYP